MARAMALVAIPVILAAVVAAPAAQAAATDYRCERVGSSEDPEIARIAGILGIQLGPDDVMGLPCAPISGTPDQPVELTDGSSTWACSSNEVENVFAGLAVVGRSCAAS